MIATIGLLAVLVVAVASVDLITKGLRAIRVPELSEPGRFRRPVFGVLGGAVVAFAALEVGLLTDDFSIEYIANNSSAETPLLFKVASGWASLEGSILLWGLVLAVYVYTVYRQLAKGTGRDQLGGGAMFVLGIVTLFFFGLMLTVSNPFRICVDPGAVGCFDGSGFPWAGAVSPLDGRGANPLLQNHFLIAVHPPMLYLGYVGMVVPFAFAMSALMIGASGSAWLDRTRAWTLVAWGFLTVGIVLGGLWSYEVLGWGGYWAWDPVENASFLPWLTATAFLHSAVVQKRRGMLQSWNFVLVIATFGLTILGTFLTRSGVTVSVHSFSQSPIGPVLLWFLLVVLVASFGLFATRAHLVGSSPRLDSLVSREGTFLFNNLLLTVFAVVVLVGTLYPMFVEAFSGSQVGVGRPFFDRMAIPLSFALLLVMGLGPVTPYRAARGSVIWERVRVPTQLALGAAALAVVLSYRNPFLLLGILTACFVIFTILRNLYRSAKASADKLGRPLPASTLRIMRNDPGFWGGQISHFGVAVLALGIALSANLGVTTKVALAPGESADVAGYGITYLGQFTRDEPNRTVIGADVDVTRDGRVVSREQPRINQYLTASGQSIATPAVDESLTGDLYLSLKDIGDDGIVLEVWWFPFIWLIWVGGFIAGLAVLWSRLVRRPSRRDVPERERADAT